MSQKEANRAQVLGLLEEHGIDQKEAAKRLGVTARQVRRITRRAFCVTAASFQSR